MKKLSLAAKIGGGFGIVILLLIIVSFVSWQGLSGVRDGFVSYRGLAEQTNLAGRLQTNMLMVRLSVSAFLRTASDKNVEEYNDYVEKMNRFLDEAQKEIQDPKRAKDVDVVKDNMHNYGKGFVRIIEIRDASEEIVNKGLRYSGPRMEKYLTEIMASAKEDNNVDVAYEAGIVLRHMLLGRLYGQKFLATSAPADYDQVKSEIAKVLTGVTALDALLQNPAHRALNAKVKEEAQIYISAFEKLATISYERNAILTDTFLKLGPEVLVAAEDINSSVKEEQDVLGP
ncbi:MAG: methyl-accepting chemotaxis protein, partial [Proteobacteria bacterium]|nr:methyl-accepting chemotaxis protein [Pseudomonadota bacterium]